MIASGAAFGKSRGRTRTVGDITPVADEGLGNSSYVVPVADGRALVVDPVREPTPYVRAAKAEGLELAWVAETHLHADFVSGARELAREGATVLAARAAELGFPHRGLDDGCEIDLGDLRIRVLSTPGHTPEHLSYLLLDGSRPVGVFTGGALLPGAVARTDLIAPDRTDELARALYRSVQEKLLSLPADTPVYPTHGAGSLCSAPTGGERVTTIGREKETNPLFAAKDEEAFVRTLLQRLGSYPPYFLRLREVNRRGPALYGTTPPPLPLLEPGEVRGLLAGGAELIDVRPIAEFAAGHIPGVLSIELRPAFATWLGWLVPEGRPLVFVLSSNQDRNDLAQQCLKIGYETFAGELAGGMAAWRSAGLPEARIALEPIERAAAPIVDVRQRGEFASGHLPDAINVELGVVADAEPPSGPLALMCGHGERAMTAASLFERAGQGDLTVLLGGPTDWSRSTGQPPARR
jgi:hydroxyacylglutathione hydrolase